MFRAFELHPHHHCILWNVHSCLPAAPSQEGSFIFSLGCINSASGSLQETSTEAAHLPPPPQLSPPIFWSAQSSSKTTMTHTRQAPCTTETSTCALLCQTFSNEMAGVLFPSARAGNGHTSTGYFLNLEGKLP